jgi:hypothetical protein
MEEEEEESQKYTSPQIASQKATTHTYTHSCEALRTRITADTGRELTRKQGSPPLETKVEVFLERVPGRREN